MENLPLTFDDMISSITEEMALELENGTALVEIKAPKDIKPLAANIQPMGLYVNDVLVFVGEIGTYTSCAEMLITYMNSY